MPPSAACLAPTAAPPLAARHAQRALALTEVARLPLCNACIAACFFQRRWHAGELSRRTRYLCRLACCLPPFTCAFAFPSLAKALSFTGIVGIILPFIVTPLVHAASLAESRERWGTAAFDRAEQTAGYSIGAFSSPSFVSVFGIFGFMLLAYCVGCGVIFGF